MGGIPPLLHAAALSAGLPLLALAAWGGRSRVHRWILAACLLSLVADGLSLAFALQRTNNHVVSYFITPLFGAAILLALAEGQRSVFERQVVIVAAWLLLLVTLALALTIEDRASFSQYASPLRALLVLSVAMWTLLRQEHGDLPGPTLASGWFWIPLGFALYSGVSAAYFPLARGFAQQDPAFVRSMAELRSWLVIIAFVLVAWGVRCLSRHTTSGRHSSPSSSRSSSS